jgi:hypothetical protein
MEASPNLKPWKPGQSGNLNGRPIGSRSAFSAGFTRDLAAVWAEKGKASMLYTAEKQPAMFFATCARLIGPEVKLTIEQNYAGLSPNELVLLKEVMAAINEGLPNAASRPPGEVFEHVLSALRQVEAKAINCP